MTKRRTRSPGFEAKAALAAIKAEKTVAELASFSTCNRTRSWPGRRVLLPVRPRPRSI